MYHKYLLSVFNKSIFQAVVILQYRRLTQTNCVGLCNGIYKDEKQIYSRLGDKLFGLLIQGIYQPLCQSVIRDNMSSVTDKSTDKTAVMTFLLSHCRYFYSIS